MHKNILQWFWCSSAFAVLCLIGLILYPSVIYTDTFSVVCAYVAIDAFAFIVGYSVLRKLSMLAFWKFAAYLVVVVAGSLAINFLLFGVAYKSMTLFAVVVFAILAFLNFVLWKTIFALTVRQACSIGMLLGLVNAFMCIAATTICK